MFFRNNLSIDRFIVKKFDALLKPYFVTMSVVILIYSFKDFFPTEGALLGSLYGNGQTLWGNWAPLWYLPHLWVVFIISFLVTKYSGYNALSNALKFGSLLLLLIIGGYSLDYFFTFEWVNANHKENITGLPFSADLLLVSVSYFLFGNLLVKEVINFRPRFFLIVIFLVGYIAIYYFTTAKIHINDRVFNDPLWAILGSAFGIYLALSLSYYLAKNKWAAKALMAAGYSSLFILIFHQLIQSELYNFLKFYIWKKPKLIWGWIAFISGISVPILLREIVLRIKILSLLYLPIKSNSSDSERHSPKVHSQSASQ